LIFDPTWQPYSGISIRVASLERFGEPNGKASTTKREDQNPI